MVIENLKTGAFDKLPCGVLIFGENATILQVNAGLCKLLEYPQAALEGLPVENILALSSRIFFNTHFFPLLRLRGNAEEIFFHLKDSQGKHIPMLVNASAEDGMYTCIFVPVWQRRKFEDELIAAKKQAEKALHENTTLAKLSEELELEIAENDRQISMLNNLNQEYIELNRVTSHDLSEPIRKLHLGIEKLKLETNDSSNPAVPVLIEQIFKSASQLKGLAFTLQQYVALEVERSEFTPISLRDCLNAANKMAQKELGFAEYFLRLDELAEIEGIQALIERMFYEIINNAIKFRDAGRDLIINVQSVLIQENSFISRKEKYHYKDFIRISITDNGIGFPEKYKDQVFAMYKKLNPDMPGYGFGLALVKKIVIQHNGFISIHSSPGVGVKIIITLPVKQGL